jgi:hypothetical protein
MTTAGDAAPMHMPHKRGRSTRNENLLIVIAGLDPAMTSRLFIGKKLEL